MRVDKGKGIREHRKLRTYAWIHETYARGEFPVTGFVLPSQWT
jgi:hypothetical protein